MSPVEAAYGIGALIVLAFVVYIVESSKRS